MHGIANLDKMNQNIAHGKVEGRWCDECGTLVLGKKCSSCGFEGRAFEMNSPGDIRPCMGDSIESVMSLFRNTFGTADPLKGRMIFFNKIPGEDRTDEIIAHGEVISVIRFDPRDRKLHLDLRQAGADIFAEKAAKNIVEIKGVSGHLKGKVVRGEDISEITGDFTAGDPVIIKKGKKAGPGTALASSNDIRTAERAVRIKDLDPADRIISPKSGREEFVRANKDHLTNLEMNAVSDIRSFVSKKSIPVTVSFSGGKDSLAAFAIASKAVKDVTLMFIDTGLEFPETSQYVERFAKENSQKLLKATAGNAFWDNVETFGPPAKDYRWCCKVCKLGPITELIAKEFPRGTITVEGNRMMESFSRSEIGFVSKNPFVPNQTNLNPVRTWSAAEIWGYIWMRGLAYNPLYDRDLERIGCYLCPSCLSSEWKNTERLHPALYEKWEDHLQKYAREKGLPPEYAEMGFWRWKVLPPKMILIAKEMELDLKPKKAAGPGLKMLKGASPCAAGGFSVEAIIEVPSKRDLSFVEDSLSVIGEVKYSSEFEIALLKTKEGRSKLFGGGQISVTAGTMNDAEMLFERTAKALIRAEMCTECGICAKGCPKKAVTINGGFRVDQKKCIRCGKCERNCMVMHYYDKIMNKRKAECDKG